MNTNTFPITPDYVAIGVFIVLMAWAATRLYRLANYDAFLNRLIGQAGTKRWRQSPTIGNGLKNASRGPAKLPTRACANNTQAWAGFGLSALRGPGFGPA